MANSASSEVRAFPRWRQHLLDGLKAAVEFLVLAMVVLAPWVFGAVDPRWEFWLYVGVAGLMALWATRLLVEFRFAWQPCPIAYGLAGLLLLALWQLAPLPQGVLAWLSPQTAQLYERVLPTEPEKLPGSVAVPLGSSGSTLSLYPHVTRHAAVRLLAVLLVFLVVRHVVASPKSLWRLSVASVVVGVGLSLLGITQVFTSSPNDIYWSFHIDKSTVFGPFISRNHFPDYANLCFGLGAGLILSRFTGQGARPSYQRPPRNQHTLALMEMLQQPQTLWVSGALVLIATGVVFSASRGGFLAFLGGGIVLLALLFRRSARFFHLAAYVLILGGALALLTWFGLERVQARLGTLIDGEALKDERITLLYRVLPLLRDFPIWGTGYGTLDYVEAIYRKDAADAGWTYQHAHNEYLEALIEGGVVRLLLTVLTIGLVFRAGYRALRRYEDRWAGGLVLGGLFGMTTLVLHSFVDFGVHLPAITLFATVLCAQLAALGAAQGEPPANVPAQAPGLAIRGLFTLSAAAAPLCLGLLLVAEGWRGAEVRRLTRAAGALRDAETPADQAASLALLERAVQVDPTDARVRLEAGERYAALFESRRTRLIEQEQTLNTVQAVLLVNPGLTPAAGSSVVSSFLILVKQHQDRRRRAVADLERRYVAPALVHFLQARNLAPTRAKAQMEIATYVTSLEKADPRRTYLDRTMLLDPMNPELWYRAGVLEFSTAASVQGCQDWRRSLEMSDVFLKKILDRSLTRLDPPQILERILPDQPRILVAAANLLFPDERQPGRQIFFAQALRLYDQHAGPWEADDLRQKALVLVALGQQQAALTAFDEALLLKPQQWDWRFELAQLLFDQARFQRARTELQAVLALRPSHGPARQLLGRVEREIAKGPTPR